MISPLEIKIPNHERSANELVKLAFAHLFLVLHKSWKWVFLWSAVSVALLKVLLQLNQFGLAFIVGYFSPNSDAQYWNDLERNLYAGFAGTILVYILAVKILRQSTAFAGLKFVTPLMAVLLALTAGFIAGVVSAVGLVFLLLPGLYLFAALQYAPLIVFVKNLTPTQAVKLSWQCVHTSTPSRKNGLFGSNFWISVALGTTNLIFQLLLEGLKWCGEYAWKHTSLSSHSGGLAVELMTTLLSVFISYVGGIFTILMTVEFFADVMAFSPVGAFLRQHTIGTEPEPK